MTALPAMCDGLPAHEVGHDRQPPISLRASVALKRKFTEPVALLSTQPADLPLPRMALRRSVDLLALRARCVEGTYGREQRWSSLAPIVAQFALFFESSTVPAMAHPLPLSREKRVGAWNRAPRSHETPS